MCVVLYSQELWLLRGISQGAFFMLQTCNPKGFNVLLEHYYEKGMITNADICQLDLASDKLQETVNDEN